jgi:prepilin-type N-terminal cleavage/methylation domain-containing protein
MPGKLRCSVPSRTHRVAGFTLLEIIVAVTVIGFLAAMAIPAFRVMREKSQAARIAGDLRAFRTAFTTYSLENAGWPPSGGAGEIPEGMRTALPANWREESPIGGYWQWESDPDAGTATIVLSGGLMTRSVYVEVDEMIDDGDISAGSLTFDGSGLRLALDL